MQHFKAVDELVEKNYDTLMKTKKNPDWNYILKVSLPILNFLSTAFFVPKKWREILGILVVALQQFPTVTEEVK